MSNSPIVPVILSGGSGTRLWPVSVRNKAKQFHVFSGGRTMLQETVARLDALSSHARPIVVCGVDQADLVRDQTADRDPQIILEPSGRNTAPAIAAACLALTTTTENPIVAVLAADHLIARPEVFATAAAQAGELAHDGYLVTFGIVPELPSTGYGYIQPGTAVGSGFRIETFAEKPDQETATRYVDEGFLWNSGMFVFAAKTYLEELANHRPDIAEAVEAAVTVTSEGVIAIDAGKWSEVPSESIDYAVMERTDHAAVIALDAGWDDLGSWRTLLDIGDKDEHGNVASPEHTLYETSSTLVRATKPVVTIGVHDLIIVETDEAILVAHKDATQDVKSAIANLPDHLL